MCVYIYIYIYAHNDNSSNTHNSDMTNNTIQIHVTAPAGLVVAHVQLDVDVVRHEHVTLSHSIFVFCESDTRCAVLRIGK